MKKILILGFVIALFFFPEKSSAQLFRLRTVDYGNVPSNQRASWDEALMEIQKQVNEQFPGSKSSERLMEGMANSSVMAGKGIGSDYASRMDVFLIGAGIGVGADLEKDKNIDSDLSGVGVQGGIILGTNLGWLDRNKILGLESNRLNIYLNYFGYNAKKELGDNKQNLVGAKFSSMGFHASYDLMTSRGSNWLRWGGLKVHTGYERNTTIITMSTSLSEDVNQTSGSGNISGTITGKPVAKINATTQSIPLEISTNVQFLYFFSLYTGLGFDFNLGGADGDGSLNADPTTLTYDSDNDPSNGTLTGPTVQADANSNDHGDVSRYFTRAFAGVQFNLPYLNIFVQADKALGTELVGATAGVRVVY